MRRKYDHEFAVSVVVQPRVMGRQRDLSSVPGDMIEDCHLYIVSSRPRLSVEPSSVEIDGDKISVTVRAQKGASFESFQLESGHDLGPGPFRWRSEWPHDSFEVVDERGEVATFSSVGSMVQRSKLVPAELRQHKILYVGQAFGKAGERNAWDRLQSHSTLQRIYSEQQADQEIWLTLCRISDVAVMQVAPRDMDAEIDGDESVAHAVEVLRRTRAPEFYEKEALAMAEAGLIRYFQPRYNEIYKNNYPDPKHVNLSTAYDLELFELIVELHSYDINAEFYTGEQPPATHNMVEYHLRDLGGLAGLLK